MAAPIDHGAVLTLWYVTTAQPSSVIDARPKADRGFGRKLLAQLNPAWPITPIGQFALNRSAKASVDEFYVAGFPGLSIVQTYLADGTEPSGISEALRSAIPAADVFAFVENEATGLGGFAHWQGGTLKRSFAARRERVYEDFGLPEPFEQPYWAGERAEQIGGIALPFVPLDLVAEAQRAWLGFDPAQANDINVVAYAVDGRPEPKLDQRKQSVGEMASLASSKLGLGDQRRDYDDYEEHEEEENELEAIVAHSTSTAKRVVRTVATKAGSALQAIKERLRHSDR